MSDEIRWLKIKSALPRPTLEEHTRPLRLFAPGYVEKRPGAWDDYTKPVTAADVVKGAEAVDELRGNQPQHEPEYLTPHSYGRAIDYKPIKPVTEFYGERVIGFDTPEDNERFWKAARASSSATSRSTTRMSR